MPPRVKVKGKIGVFILNLEIRKRIRK